MVYDDDGDYTVPGQVPAAGWHGMVAMMAGGAGGGDGVGVGGDGSGSGPGGQGQAEA